MANRRGFTLIETLIVIVVAGLIMALGFPRLRAALVSSNLRNARNTVATLHARARAVAVERGQRSEIRINGNRAVVVVERAVPNGATTHDTVGSVRDLDTEFGATLSSTDASIGFDPRGVGTNTSIVTMGVTKGGHTLSLIVSPFGRLQP